MIKKFTRNPWLVYLPFLFYYVYIIVKNKWPSLYGDELRYVQFAKNLTHGFYSPYPAHINLWSGPGYPIILMPFIALNTPALYMTLLNAIFQYLAVVFLYKALKLVSNYKIALVAGLLFALYPNGLSMLPILYTEGLTCSLVSLFIFYATLYHIRDKIGYGVLTGLVLGFLVLTKILFGYVILISLIVCLVSLAFRRFRRPYLKAVKILSIAFAICIPYLVYTYHITGKVLYWGNSGGMSLYWMSTPYEHEYGDWKLPELNNKQYPTLLNSPKDEVVGVLKKNHTKEINAILKHDEITQDDLFKQAAIRNIKQHPLKFAGNYIYNVSRMLFNFPYSYSYQDGAILGNILRGSLILWGSIAGIILSLINWRKVIFPVKLILLVTGTYLLLSGAVSAYPRQFDVVVPVFLFWFGYLLANIGKVNLKFFKDDDLEDIELTELEGLGITVRRPNSKGSASQF